MKFSPVYLYVYVWLLTISLYAVQISPIFTVDTQRLLIFVLFLLAPLLPYLYITRLLVDNKKIIPGFNGSKLIGFIFGVVTIFEVALAGNFPLLGALSIGKYVHYTDYGIPGLHGLVNGLHLVLCVIYSVRYRSGKSNADLLVLTVLFLLSLLTLSRQLSMSIIVQFLLIYLYYHNFKINVKRLSGLVFTVIVILLLFSYLGDLRSGSGFIYGYLQIEGEYPEAISGLFWIYIYIVSPIHNLLNNIFEIESVYLPINSLLSLFPSPIRAVFSDFLMNDLYLEHSIFNVGTAFPSIIGDFGLLGISGLSFLIMTFDIFIRVSPHPMTLPIYIFLGHAIIFSVFGNFFFSLPFLIQMIILLLCQKKYSR